MKDIMGNIVNTIENNEIIVKSYFIDCFEK